MRFMRFNDEVYMNVNNITYIEKITDKTWRIVFNNDRTLEFDLKEGQCIENLIGVLE